MCGISAILARDPGVVRAATDKMMAAMPHRGPDNIGCAYIRFGEYTLGLGHRRLAIIDLSPAGHEPMLHPPTGNQLNFNGEIYNFRELRNQLEPLGHQFIGHGDAEVLLHALSEWGIDAIPRLHGMFAFAFFDAARNELIVARDSIGIKPLYFARLRDGGWIFASEVRAILATGLVCDDLDRAGIAGLLAYGAVQHPRTIYSAIQSLPPGSYWAIDATRVDSPPPSVQFWQVPTPRDATGDFARGVRDTIESSVKNHLVADVPLGIFLSSGIDSTIVAGTARNFSSNVQCFTVGFSDNSDLSEMRLAAETAQLFGLPHVPIEITAKEAEDAARHWLAAADTPSVDGMNVYVISRAIRAAGMTVALSGQGGDELFGGYPSFRDLPRMMRWLARTQWMPPAARSALAGAMTISKPASTRQKLREIAAGDGSLLSLYAHRRRLLSNQQLAALGMNANGLNLTNDYLDRDEAAAIRLIDNDPIWSISKLETKLYLGNMLLRDSDVNGMAHSLEIRVPLLDQRVLDFVCALPGHLRLPPGAPLKHLLRTAFADLFRPALTQQGKKGFTLPIRRWMLGPLREMCDAGLAHLKSTGLFQPAGLDAIWQSFLRESESPIWSRAWMLCVLGLYLRRNRPA